ncbi:DNA polymerase I [Vibrio crassostreae]|uniref:DNA polymerase n=1 Tax=Vibrio splendidus TaxID=29497 RepID=A0ABV4M1M9_VIBSP|nr:MULTISPECIES: DNA polymerase [Vibrio]CAH7196723.1 DNA polymerase I [Vibrio chagasii]MCW4444706.1 DNA polymerase [Vibrio splendidus]PTO62505.1 DNA polymerase I [Vibrio splendidus]TCV10151.1 DNA polymerase family A [Vibrio crassostreae]TKE96705.1 DNA polymerase I [Vibrio kanaloae]
MLSRQLNVALARKVVPQHVVQQVSAFGETIPCAVLVNIKRYLAHVNHRPAIRIDVDYLNRKIAKYSKKKSNRSLALVSQLVRFKASLTHDLSGDWHRQVVNVFGTKTGRDTTSGSALNLIPKHHWQGLLSPQQGYCYVLLDYDQQEPMIAAQKAKCMKLLNLYEQGDIYELLIETVTDNALTRTELKTLIVMQLYGASIKRIAHELSQPQSNVMNWLMVLKKALSPIDYYLDGEALKAKRQGEVRSLDWRMGITQEINTLTIRNWPIQATGADIMRRACFNLDKAKLPVLLTNHDSFLVRLETDKYDYQLRQAKKALTDASAEVLDGFKLNVQVEMQLPAMIRDE